MGCVEVKKRREGGKIEEEGRVRKVGGGNGEEKRSEAEKSGHFVLGFLVGNATGHLDKIQ